jgi:DNA polymerase delta subunit 3
MLIYGARMLFDFHQKQNATKPRSVHATYLLTGIARAENASSTNETLTSKSGTPRKDGLSQTQDDEDSIMQSSPFPSSFPEPEPLPEINLNLNAEDEDLGSDEEPDGVPTTTIILVTEEDLEGMPLRQHKIWEIRLTTTDAKEEFEEINSIFVYSLEPGLLQDIDILKNSNVEVAKTLPNEDPLEAYQQYGIIHNPNVKVSGWIFALSVWSKFCYRDEQGVDHHR